MQAGYCPCSHPWQRPPWEYIVPSSAGFPLHGYTLSHYVNAQLDMKRSTDFVYVFVLAFTASGSTVVVQMLWFGVPFWQVQCFQRAQAWPETSPTEGRFSCLSSVGSKTAMKRLRLHQDGKDPGGEEGKINLKTSCDSFQNRA